MQEFLRAVIGRRRLENGHEMPPESPFLLAVQVALAERSSESWKALQGKGLAVLTGSEGPEPVDTTGFKRWWTDMPRDLNKVPNARRAFNLSEWIIADAEAAFSRDMAAEVLASRFLVISRDLS